MSFITGLRNSFKSKVQRDKSPSSPSPKQPNAIISADSLDSNRAVTTIETTEITYLNSNNLSSPTHNCHSITRKRSSSTRRLPFATISNNTPDQLEAEQASYKYEQNLLSPNQSPSIIFKSDAATRRDDSDADCGISSNDDKNRQIGDDDLNETKNNINYAKQGFAFIRSTKSYSFRHRRSFNKKR